MRSVVPLDRLTSAAAESASTTASPETKFWTVTHWSSLAPWRNSLSASCWVVSVARNAECCSSLITLPWLSATKATACCSAAASWVAAKAATARARSASSPVTPTYCAAFTT